MRYNTKIVYKKPIAAILFSVIIILSIFSGVALADKVGLPDKGVVLADKLDRSNEIPEDYVLSPDRATYINADSISDFTKDLPVPYIHQCWDTPNDFDGRHACGATSAVMILSYYNKLDPWPCDCSSPHEHVSNYGNYICKQYTYDDYLFDTMTKDASNNPAYGAYGYIHHNAADPTDHRAWAWRMEDYFEKHGISITDTIIHPSELDVKTEIDAGYPVIASTKLLGGHILVIKGYTDDGYYIVNDPYGNAASGNYDGANVLYTWDYMGVGSKWIVTIHETSALSLDLIFTIDTTGSMYDDIAYVKASASAIADEILSDIPTARIAVVDYRDFSVSPYGGAGDYPFHDDLAFSTDKPSIVAAIQGLTLGWGADWRESVYSALMHSIDSTSLGGWRGSDKAAKVIILMGDAPPHDPEPFTGYTLSSVVTAAYNADPVIIYPIQIGGTVEKFEELADLTGGVAFTAASAGEVVDAILEAIGEIKTKPLADANGPYTGFVGESITFDGTGSYDLDGTIVSYEWDLDDDGVFDDATGAQPTITFGEPYSGNIHLQVTDDDGATDIDSTTLTVSAIANQPPVADVNGPYTGFVGESITFDGTGSYDLDGTIVSYEWDLDDGGVFDDATGAQPTITFGEPYSGDIHLQVTDDDGATDIDTTTLTVKIPATIDFDPDTLNLKSEGRWVTIYIEFPEGYDVTDIDTSTILVNDQAHAEMRPIEVGDYDSDGVPDLMVKFDKADVQELLEAGDEVEITVTGRITSGTPFAGSDTIRVIDKGKGK